MGTNQQIGERDRDRAILKLRWLTALTGIASLAIAALGTSAAAQASTVTLGASGTAKADPVAGSLSPQQLAALNFALPRQSTIVIWQTPGQSAVPGRAPASTQAPAAAPAPRPAPTPPPAPVATSGTS
jgi:cell division septation protein DedD